MPAMMANRMVWARSASTICAVIAVASKPTEELSGIVEAFLETS